MKKLVLRLIAGVWLVVGIVGLWANPVAVYQDTSLIQDDWIVQDWLGASGLPNAEELGTFMFPPDPGEVILASQVPWQGHIPCPAEYRGGGAVQVQIVNLTGRDWPFVVYVADPETSFSNWDELIGQVGGPACIAFLIDSIGENTPLVYESMLPDNVFQAGEVWQFVVQEYVNSLGLSPAALGSLGVAGGSLGDTLSSASIIAVPEPTAVSFLGLAGAGLIACARARRR